MSNSEFNQSYTDYLLHPSPFRKFVRGFYLRNVAHYAIGKTLDYGCGIGQLLKILPEGSMGVEINATSVDYCVSQGLNVKLYDPEEDNYELKFMKDQGFETFNATHVFEHIEDSQAKLKKVFEACHKNDIKRIVLTVPGFKGYQTDKTHKTFITVDYLKENGLVEYGGYKLTRNFYFPVNSFSFSKIFTHNELRVVFDRVEEQ